jgi:class 3 adenylate cyclase
MADGMAADELAALAGSSRANVERLTQLGILTPDDAGRYEPSAVAALRLMHAMEEAGVDLEAVGRGFRTGALTFGGFDTYFARPAPFVGTFGELAGRIGVEFDAVARQVVALGFPLPRPGDPVRGDEARLLEETFAVWGFVPPDELARLGRVFGDNVRRVAQGSIRFFDATVNEPSRRPDLALEERQERAREVGVGATGLAFRTIEWLFRRHFESELIRYMTDGTERFLEEQGIAPARPQPEPAIAFLDLTGFTALTEEHGDLAAADAAGRLAAVVAETARAYGGEPVKWLGDGVMFHFPRPAAGLLGALALVERTPHVVQVPARVGLHAGPVVQQDGDYYGRTVNVAARIADYARPGEVLVSEAARDAASADDLEFREIGPVALRGLRESLSLFAVARRA